MEREGEREKEREIEKDLVFMILTDLDWISLAYRGWRNSESPSSFRPLSVILK